MQRPMRVNENWQSSKLPHSGPARLTVSHDHLTPIKLALVMKYALIAGDRNHNLFVQQDLMRSADYQH